MAGKQDAAYCDARDIDYLISTVAGRSRVLIWGAMGSGKSTLALALLPALTRLRGSSQLLQLDPGSPPCGVPGALCRVRFREERLCWTDCQALCTLNAVRFRLPLLQAAKRLSDTAAARAAGGPLLVDPPGATRGVGGAELLSGLHESLRFDCILLLHGEDRPSIPPAEIRSVAADVICVKAHPETAKPAGLERLNRRTELWDRYLADGGETSLSLEQLPLLGTPPPVAIEDAWRGRQIALLDGAGATLAMGEVVSLDKGNLTVRWGGGDVGDRVREPAALLIRDAGRDAEGRLATVSPPNVQVSSAGEPVEMVVSANTFKTLSPPLSSRVGPAWATLVGGVFGDPLLHVRLRHRKTSLFFDLGDPAGLMPKMAHQVRYVFLSHCHLDHFGGFLWFLRSRIGDFPAVTIFGPAETITRVEHFIQAVTWDRIEESGPVFEVCEIGPSKMRRARLQPGKQGVRLPPRKIEDGVIAGDDEYRVQAAILDHRIPSAAYALIFANDIAVRKNVLLAMGLTPGPWLGRLKAAIASGTGETMIDLPDGTREQADGLRDELLIVKPGKKLVYATDFADTDENRAELVRLAAGAHTLFCETMFSESDRAKARATQHLTTRAALEIARAAGVERLAPFHFSRRYERSSRALYAELAALAGPVRILGSSG